MIAFAIALGMVSNPTFDAVLADGIARSDDKFANRSVIPPLGTTKIFVPFSDGEDRYPSADTSAFFTYVGDVLELHFEAPYLSNVMDIVNAAPSEKIRYWNEAVIYSRISPAGAYHGVTAFNASAKVEKYSLRTVRLRFDERNGHPHVLSGVARIKIDPKSAKRLLETAAVEIGLASDNLVKSGECKRSLSAPTFRHPQEVDRMDCKLAGEVIGVRIVRQDTGEELLSIKRPAVR